MFKNALLPSILLGTLSAFSINAAQITANSTQITIESKQNNLASFKLFGGGISLTNSDGQFTSESEFVDGIYQFEVYAKAPLQQLAARGKVKLTETINNGRDETQLNQRKSYGVVVIDSGSFRLHDGQLVVPESEAKVGR